jgi:hypothetical protein
MKDIYEGLGILLRYVEFVDNDSFYAEHDQIWCSGPKKDRLSPEDKIRLAELDWFWDHEYECWSHFT